MLATSDLGPAALSHAGRTPTDFQAGMYKRGLLDLSLPGKNRQLLACFH